MDFTLSDRQRQAQQAAREFFSARCPIDKVARLADGERGWDPVSWRQLAALDWFGLPAAGAGDDPLAGVVEAALVLEEAGRALYPGPLFSTFALALPALAAGRDADPSLSAVLAGERSATLAVAEDGGPATLAAAGSVACAASLEDGGWTLSGAKALVPDLALVDDAVVVARAEPAGVGLWRVDLHGPGVRVAPCATVDATRRLGGLLLDGAPASLLVAPGEAAATLAATRLRALAALAAEAVGVTQRVLAIAGSYAASRQVAGRPIGSYQAVAHRLADVYVALELARSLAWWAAWAVAADDADAAGACAAAKSAAAEAAVAGAEAAIQTMGAVGFTWQHPLHRFYRRALWIEAFEGGGRQHRADLAAMLLDG